MVRSLKILSYILIAIFALNTFNCVVYADGEDTTSADCASILGDPGDNTSTAFLLNQIFAVMKYAAPVLVLVFSIIDFTKAVASQDKDLLSKATKRTFVRLIVGLVVFLVPVLLDFLFKVLGWYGTCGIN